MSGSVKAYFALKVTGHRPDAAYMVRARAGHPGGRRRGEDQQLHPLLPGPVGNHQLRASVRPSRRKSSCLPKWMPFNIYEMSAWSRTISDSAVDPVGVQAGRASCRPNWAFASCFATRPEDLPVTMPRSEQLDDIRRPTRIDWHRVLRPRRSHAEVRSIVSGCLRCDRWPIRRAERWMCERFAGSDGLGAIFPPIIWSVVALKCLGHRRRLAGGDDRTGANSTS